MFFKKSSKELFISNERKLLENRTKRTLRFAEYAAELNECAFICETAIEVQRKQSTERRKKCLSDNMQKMYIHDAVVCLLAIEEAQLELNALAMVQDLKQAENALQKVLGKMYSVNHYLSLTRKDVKNNLGMEFDDSVEPVTFSERADLVDAGFVEKIISGCSIEECLASVNGQKDEGEKWSDMFDADEVKEDIEARRRRLEQDADET